MVANFDNQVGKCQRMLNKCFHKNIIVIYPIYNNLTPSPKYPVLIQEVDLTTIMIYISYMLNAELNCPTILPSYKTVWTEQFLTYFVVLQFHFFND